MKRMNWLLGAAVVLAMGGVSLGEDWPKWLGPRGDGISKEALPDALPAEMKKVWTAKVGNGYASPIAVKETIYAFMAEGGKEQLIALNAADGKELWRQSYPSANIKDGGYKGTRATPAFEDGKIYTLGAGGQAACWDTGANGKVVWVTDVLKETQAKNLTWGTASSPLILGNRIYVQAGSGGPVAVGLNKATGKIEWRAEEKGLSSYAHPVLVEAGGVKQLIVFGGKALYGIAPETGKTIWREKWETSYDVNATTPLYRDGHLMVSSGYGHGAMMLKLTGTGAEKLWESKVLGSRFPQMILDGDFVYGNSEGKLKCLSWPDGKQVWQSDIKLNTGGSLVRSGDKLLALSERGKLYLLKADGTGQTKLGEASLFDAEQVWATPLLYEGKLYAKGGDELACFELK